MTNRPDKTVKMYPLFMTSSRNHKAYPSEAFTARTYANFDHNRRPQRDQEQQQQQQQHVKGNSDRETSDHVETDDEDDEDDDDDDDDDRPLMSLATSSTSSSTTPTMTKKKRQFSSMQEGPENTFYGNDEQSRNQNKNKSTGKYVAGKIQTYESEKNPLTERTKKPLLNPESSNRPTSSPRRPHGRRIYSDSAMDFVVPRTPNNTRGRLLTRLIQRSTTGGPLSTNTRMSPSKGMWPKKWKIPTWVSLESPTTASHFGSSSIRNIDCMAWDTMGVLLAVSIGKIVSIYDWDMVRAADVQGRRDRARGCHESEWNIAPVVRLQVPCPVASLVWNPFNVDQLAVGFRVSGQVQVYDIDLVARWLADQTDSGTLSHRPPPQKTYRSVGAPRISGNVADIVFLNSEHIVASIGTTVVCWMVPKKIQAPSIVVWRYQPPSSVTSIAPLSSNLIVVGTSQGHLSILNWTIHTKERSFSNERRPLVLQTWIPHAALKIARDDNLLRMGILKLGIETGTNLCADSVAGDENWGVCRITWVTQSGWLLSSSLESPTTRGSCSVHHAPPQVIYRNSDGQRITSDRKSWSLPQEPVGVHLSDSATCLSEVPAVTRILSHHDKFVLDSQPCSTRSTKRAILIRCRHDQALNSISLPPSVKKVPQTLAVHPSLEWIVLGEGEKLHVLVGRDCNYKDVNHRAARL